MAIETVLELQANFQDIETARSKFLEAHPDATEEMMTNDLGDILQPMIEKAYETLQGWTPAQLLSLFNVTVGQYCDTVREVKCGTDYCYHTMGEQMAQWMPDIMKAGMISKIRQFVDEVLNDDSDG